MGAFVFWGLFAAATLIVVAYAVWMVSAERADVGDAADAGSPQARPHDPGGAA